MIDRYIEHLLDDLHELPTENAIFALHFFSKQKPLPKNAKKYADLPESLLGKPFEKCLDTLKDLSKMMQNRHPHKETKYHSDLSNEVNFGVFGLKKWPISDDYPINAKLVHNYLIQQFQIKIWTLKCFDPVIIPHLNAWKRYLKPLYLASLAIWVKNNTPSEAMKKMIASKGILAAKIRYYIKKNDPAISDNERAMIAEAVIKDICKLSPTRLDNDAKILEAVFSIQPTNELQQTALNKLKEHLQNQSFTEIISASQSFIVIERTYRVLSRLGNTLNQIEDFNDINKICTEYLKQFLETPPDEIKGLKQEKLREIDAFYEKAAAYIKQENVDYFTNVFSEYFLDPINRWKRFATLLELDSQNKIHLDDAWIRKIFTTSLDPYFINRLFLHACFTLPTQWTPLFASVLNNLLTLWQTPNGIKMDVVFRRNSYPLNFIKQLNWLNILYKAHQKNKESVKQIANEQPETIFPILYFPNSVYDLPPLFLKISPVQFAQLYDQSKELLFRLIQTQNDFNIAFRHSDLKTFTQACDIFLPALIKKSYDLRVLIAYYDNDQGIAILKSLTEKWSVIIKSEDDFIQTYNSLNQAQSMVFLHSLDGKWTDIIETANLFSQLNTILKGQYHTSLLDAFSNKWSELIGTGDDFCQIHAILEFENKSNPLINKLSGAWALIIRNANDFCKIIPYLKLKQFTVVREELKKKWQDIIQSATDFEKIIAAISNEFNNLTPEMTTVIFRSLQPKLQDMIENPKDLSKILIHLTSSQCITTLGLLKHKIAKIIPTANDFILLISSPIKQKQKNVIFSILVESLPILNIIKKSEDLNGILNIVTLNQCVNLCAVLKTHLSNLLITTQDFIRLFENLTEEKTVAVLNTIKNQLPDLLFRMSLITLYDHFRYERHYGLASDIIAEKANEITQKTLDYIQPIMKPVKTVSGLQVNSLFSQSGFSPQEKIKSQKISHKTFSPHR